MAPSFSFTQLALGATFYNIVDESLLKTALLRLVFCSLYGVSNAQERLDLRGLSTALQEMEHVLVNSGQLREIINRLGVTPSVSEMESSPEQRAITSSPLGLNVEMERAIPILKSMVLNIWYVYFFIYSLYPLCLPFHVCCCFLTFTTMFPQVPLCDQWAAYQCGSNMNMVSRASFAS